MLPPKGGSTSKKTVILILELFLLSGSPDLTPLDFFLWGYIKSLVYNRNYDNVDQLKTAISAAFQEVTRKQISSTLANFEARLRSLIQCNGGHTEK